MKQLFCLATLVLLFWAAAATAQKNVVFTDVRYYPINENPVYGATFGYFRQVAPRRELGLKFAVTANDPADKYPYPGNPYLLMANIDITNRWTLSKARKSRWFAEAGLSALMKLERRPPYTLECGTGLTPAELERLVQYASQYHQTTIFSPGLSTAVSWEYALTRKFMLGLSCLGNIYFLDADNFSNLLLLPSLHSAYRF